MLGGHRNPSCPFDRGAQLPGGRRGRVGRWPLERGALHLPPRGAERVEPSGAGRAKGARRAATSSASPSLKTMGKPCLSDLQGNHRKPGLRVLQQNQKPGFLRWREMDCVHPQQIIGRRPWRLLQECCACSTPDMQRRDPLGRIAI